MTDKDQSQRYEFNDKVEAQFIGGIHYHGVDLKLKPPNNVPSPTARYFVGREKALQDLDELVQSNKTVSISAIQGMGGIGKTELAKYYAITYQNDYPDGIAWLNFGTVGIKEEIVSFGRNILKLSFPEDAPIDDKVAQVWQDWPIKKGALVIIDNVNRKEDYAKIKPYLPTGTGFKVVVTSRVKFSNIPAYNLELLDLDKAVELLESLADAKNRDWNQELAKTLCKDKLGRLPLAITLVGCYLANDPGLTIESVINRLNRKGLAAKPLNPSDSTVAERGVKAAIALTYEVLEAENQDLAVFLSLFACAPLEWRLVESAKPKTKTRFWQFWLRKAKYLKNASLQQLENWRMELLRYSLLEAEKIKNTTTIGYQFHPLVWEFLRDKVNKRLDEQVIRDFVKAIVTEANTIEYNAPIADYERVRPSIPHIEEVAEVWIDYIEDEDIITPYTRLASYYESLVNYVKAEYWEAKNVELAKKRLPDYHPDIAISLSNLANLYGTQGKYTEAELLHLEALEIDRQSLPLNHPQLASHLNNFAVLYEAQGKYAASEPLKLEALKIARQSLSPNHPQLAIHLNNLANLNKVQGKYTEAESFYLEAIEIDRQSLPVNHPQLAIHLNNLAFLYQEQGKYEKSALLYLETLEIVSQSLPPNHPNLATHLNNLAFLYQEQGKYEKLEVIYLKVLEIYRQSLPPNHPSLAISLNNLAALYEVQGKYTASEPLKLEALKIARQSLPPNHFQLGGHLNNLAALYEAQKKYSEAEPLYVEAIEICQEALGEDHPTTQKVISNYEKMRSESGLM
ncbi:MAG: tetratricopeptide repeat protein [Crocosphaera sp.]|nr:tetratricopeptide repeat protein [Crocosphaera sp.]